MSDLWHECEEHDAIPGLVFAHVSSLDTAQSLLHKLNAENAARYAGKNVPGIGGPRAIGSFAYGDQSYAVTENIIASVVQTATALIAANRPRPTFLTDGAEWSKQQHAKKLGKFIIGLYDRLKIYPLWVRAFRDTCVQGTGVVKVFADRDQPCVERRHIDRIIVDEQEAMDGPPRQLHERAYVDRAVLRGHYPDHADLIERANSAESRRTTNLIEVIESWHLPSSEGADDGCHTVCIGTACLFHEVYKKDYFPFVFSRWDTPEVGFYGTGLVEPLTGLQIRLNQLNKFIKKCQDLIARPDIYGAFDQRMPDAFFENGVGRFFRTKDGKPPTFYTPQALNAETYNERRYIVERAFALAGVGEMSAQGQKQPGIESGVAIRAVNDIQTGRFGLQSEGFEDAHLETAERLVWVMKDISDVGRKKVTVAFRAKKFAETIRWDDVDPKEDVFHVDIEASSLLSRTPAGRLQGAMDMLQVGAIDKNEFRHLVDHPDLERSLDLKDAAIQDIEATIENLLDGNWESPEPLQDLAEGIKRVQMAYLRARRQGCPDDRLQMLRDWIDHAQAQLAEAASATSAQAPPPAPMDPMAAGMDPMAMPGAPPGGMVPGAPLPGPGSPLPM